MPIYEYQCASCGHQLEALQKVSDEPLKECPECHKNALGKLISATSFQLKGTGWYATDFKTKSKTEQKSSDTDTTKTDTTTPTTDVKKDTASTTTATDTSTKGTVSE